MSFTVENSFDFQYQAMTGLNICFTNIRIADRRTLITKCMQMGARISCELSNDVSHLIVGEIQPGNFHHIIRLS